ALPERGHPPRGGALAERPRSAQPLPGAAAGELLGGGSRAPALDGPRLGPLRRGLRFRSGRGRIRPPSILTRGGPHGKGRPLDPERTAADARAGGSLRRRLLRLLLPELARDQRHPRRDLLLASPPLGLDPDQSGHAGLARGLQRAVGDRTARRRAAPRAAL